MNKIQWVQPETLLELRKASGLQPGDVEYVAQKLAEEHYAPITRQDLENWERGLDSPDLERLETLAKIYGCPVGLFFLPPPEISRAIARLNLWYIRAFENGEMRHWLADLLQAIAEDKEALMEEASTTRRRRRIHRITVRLSREEWEALLSLSHGNVSRTLRDALREYVQEHSEDNS